MDIDYYLQRSERIEGLYRPNTVRWLFIMLYSYLGNCISVVEGCQHVCLLTAVPAEFAAYVFEFRVSGTLVEVTDIGAGEVRLGDRGLVDHGDDGDAQRLAESPGAEETEERHDVEDQCAPRNVAPISRLVLNRSRAVAARNDRSCRDDVHRFHFAPIWRAFVTACSVTQPVVHDSARCCEIVVTRHPRLVVVVVVVRFFNNHYDKRIVDKVSTQCKQQCQRKI